jgi:hypothetical protein
MTQLRLFLRPLDVNEITREKKLKEFVFINIHTQTISPQHENFQPLFSVATTDKEVPLRNAHKKCLVLF